MKQILIFTLFMFLLFFLNTCKGEEPTSYIPDEEHFENRDLSFVVYTPSLLIREKPNKKSKVIKTLSFGESVDINEDTGIQETINNVQGQWVVVGLLNNNGNDYTGYAFNGHICTRDKFEKKYLQPFIDSLTSKTQCKKLEYYDDCLKCYHKFEKDVIKKKKLPIVRKDLTLSITAANGNKLNLVDHPNSDGINHYILRDFIPELNCYYIDVWWWEGHGDILVSASDNKQIQLNSEIILSPLKKYFITCNSDLGAQYTVNGIQLFKINKDKSISIEMEEATEWGASDCRWISNEKVEIEREDFNNEKSKAELIYKNNKWILNEKIQQKNK